MKPVLLLLAVSALAFGQVPPMIPSAPDGGPVGGAGNLTTVGSVPYVSATGVLNQDATVFFWDATNNRLGIGTATPLAALHVKKGGSGALPASSGTTPTGSAIFGTVNDSQKLYMGVDPASPYSAWLQVANENNLALTYPLLLNPNGGNVGIGTPTPAAPLTVGTAVGSPATNGNAAIINAANTTLSSRGGNLQVITTNSSAVDLGGSIGLGGQYNTLANSVEFASIAGRKENGTAANFAGYLQFVTTADGVAPTEKMRITSAGSVLIGGTTDGAYRLDVAKSGASGTARFYDQTATTGSTLAVFRAGVAQSGNVLEVQNNAGTVIASVGSTGNLYSANALSVGATFSVVTLYSPSDGVLRLTDNAGTSFNRLQFGGTTSSFPSIQRSTTKLFFRLADDSAGATVRAGGYESSDGTAGATVTTCTGFKNGLCISGT